MSLCYTMRTWLFPKTALLIWFYVLSGLLDSNKSVDDILAEAEHLVTMSLTRLSQPSSRSITPTKQARRSPVIGAKTAKSVQNSVKFSDVTVTIPFQETISTSKMKSRSYPNLVKTQLLGTAQKDDSFKRPTSSASSLQSRSRLGTPPGLDKMRRPDRCDLRLSALTPVYETCASPSSPRQVLPSPPPGQFHFTDSLPRG